VANNINTNAHSVAQAAAVRDQVRSHEQAQMDDQNRQMAIDALSKQLKIANDSQQKDIRDALKRLEDNKATNNKSANEAKARAREALEAQARSKERAIAEAREKATKVGVGKSTTTKPSKQQKIYDDVYQRLKLAKVMELTEARSAKAKLDQAQNQKTTAQTVKAKQEKVQQAKQAEVKQAEIKKVTVADPKKLHGFGTDNFSVAQLQEEKKRQQAQLTPDGKPVDGRLPPGGFDLSDYTLDPHKRGGLNKEQSRTGNVPAHVTDGAGNASNQVLTPEARLEGATEASSKGGPVVGIQTEAGVGFRELGDYAPPVVATPAFEHEFMRTTNPG
jgi:myosin heavy subunit